MVRTIKLVIYYFLYQLLFTSLITLPSIWVQLMNNGGDVNSFTGTETSINTAGITMVLSGIAMIWHLIHFKYVKFNLKSFGEVSGKTIGLSIPLIVAGMIFINLCSEFIGLPDMMQDTFRAMSRNVFGIISIAIMAPLVEELLFRGAIQGHLLRKGMKPVYAILIASAVFGIVHMNPIQIPFAFAIGMIFGWLYYRTGSVVPGIIGHFINNSIACIQMAVMTKEEFNTKTIEWLGEGPTYALFAISLAVTIGMFLYLKKRLPKAPDYTSPSCHPEQGEGSEVINPIK
ncbi:MAG: CPBP family intramembrane metalloprotease [Bacteroidaceae bacterium]|nr:CPBP family intramembrane metalloprotease [Bacteroidaceae bacterium]